jgi:hypothetical protein
MPFLHRVAFGNVGTIAPLILLCICLPFFYSFRESFGHTPDDDFADDKKEEQVRHYR